MARIARVVVAGLPHHVRQRGNRRMQTFFGEVRFNSGYDVSSNRKWRENAVTTGKSELYTYDRLNRLTNWDAVRLGKIVRVGVPVTFSQ